MPRLNPGSLYVLSVPLAAGVATVEGLNLAGLNYTGFLWMGYLAAGVFVILAEFALSREARIPWPCGPWLAWFGFVWLSLAWCQGVGSRNVQDALQLTMPLLVGLAAALFIRTEAELRLLLWTFVPATALLSAGVVADRVGAFGAAGMTLALRSLALTAALAGCVFLAECPRRWLLPLAGWAVCVLLTVLTGSRMATITLLLLPVLHPLYRNRLWQLAAVLLVAGLGVALFYSPVFQKRFFYEGKGTLTDVFEGRFLSFGRFESWPAIWEEAWRHPVLGAGVGTVFDFVPTVWEGMHHVHNDYLRIGFELGLVGLTIYLVALLWQLRDLAVRMRRSDGAVRTAFAACWLGLLTLVISSCTDNTIIYNLWYMNPLFALLGGAYGVVGHNPALAATPRQGRAEVNRIQRPVPALAGAAAHTPGRYGSDGDR